MAVVSGGFDPKVAVVPIFGCLPTDAAGVVQAFLGTGSFVGDGSILLTADHVIDSWSGPYVIAVMPDVSTVYPLRLRPAEWCMGRT